jgi:hypothetical protein
MRLDSEKRRKSGQFGGEKKGARLELDLAGEPLFWWGTADPAGSVLKYAGICWSTKDLEELLAHVCVAA